MVVHDLAEAAAEGPAFGFDPGKEGVGEVVQGGVGGTSMQPWSSISLLEGF